MNCRHCSEPLTLPLIDLGSAPPSNAYLSKAALTRAFEALRGRYSREGITFTTIHLGAVDTGMGSGSSSWFRLTSEQAVYRILAAVDRIAEPV